MVDVNEGNDNYENAEESEYHFSDDEVSYEADPDAAKAVPVAPQGGGGLAGLASSRRMIISLGVFLTLVFVVYKMVAPSNAPPPTEISPAQPTATTAMNTAAPAPTASTAPTTAAAPQPATAPAAMAMQPQTQVQPQPSAPVVSAPPVMAVPAPAPAAAPMQAAPTENDATIQQASMTAPPTTLPSDANVGGVPPVVASQAAAVAATSDQLMGQMQAEYAQRLADYQAENKALQDQVQTLNARVASMETEMSQLIQTLTKQFQNTTSADGSGDTAASATTDSQTPAVSADVKLPYTVQAIIPGRAWLRSDNGDTLTVAEGDTIKDVGQVSKIDPYDGVVEIKVGNKTVSLSYGGSGG